MILIDRLDYCAKEQQELSIAVRGIARRQQIHACIGSQRPVVVLAAAVHAGKRFFVQQTNQSVLQRHFLHNLHRQLIVIGGDVYGGVNRRQLVLRRCDLVVSRFGEDAQLPKLFVQLSHIGRNARLDGAEVVVVHLLTLRRLRAE